MKYCMIVSIFALGVALTVPDALAITIPTVPVGNPGNPALLSPGDYYHPNPLGSVGYIYNMGTTEITNAQYTAFLNAVAATDAYELYSTNMASDTLGGIVRSGSSGSYFYSIKAPALNGAYAYANKPVVFVGVGDAMRFANWLHNGQPTGPENAGTTEDGAYTLNGATDADGLYGVTRNPGARWWLPSENEWFKAAFYDGPGNTYYAYPTGTDSVPDNNLPSSDTGNSANFYDLGNGYTTGNSSYPLTDAGAYALSASPYGTFDQCGNVWEWTESLTDIGGYRVSRGGNWGTYAIYLDYSKWASGDPSYGGNGLGFRVANAVPEPGGIRLCLAGVFMLALMTGRKSVPTAGLPRFT